MRKGERSSTFMACTAIYARGVGRLTRDADLWRAARGIRRCGSFPILGNPRPMTISRFTKARAQ
jgi:hypothetical protein